MNKFSPKDMVLIRYLLVNHEDELRSCNKCNAKKELGKEFEFAKSVTRKAYKYGNYYGRKS